MMSEELTFEEKIRLVEMFMDLRSTPPFGVVGLMELRNLVEELFPVFSKVRDTELDESLDSYIQSVMEPPAAPREPGLQS